MVTSSEKITSAFIAGGTNRSICWIAFRNAPVYPPAWPVPVPNSLSLSGMEEETDKGQAKAGYDPDDSQLGGAFVQDNQLVFEAC